jgi:aminotransferase
MKRHINQRMAELAHSEIRAMTQACVNAKGLNMAQGVCDTPVPSVVLRAAAQAMERGKNVYSRFDGLPELRQAIAEKLAQYNGIVADPETDVTVSAGATGSFHCACLALLNPGDEVILFEPYYGYHINTLVATQAAPVTVRMTPPDWSFSSDDLEQVKTSRTRAMIVNTPANPSGKVFTRSEMETIARFAIANDLFVFTDEIYEHFLYDGSRHIALATLPGMKERTITISGLSKTFSITGWRIGYSLSDARWTQTIGYFNDLVYVCAPAPLQVGVAKGLINLGPEYYEGLTKAYSIKRDMICSALAQAGMKPYIPQGAYYVLADMTTIPGKSGKEKAMNLLKRTGVASVPGGAFYHDGSGENLARFCFAKEDSILDEACKRLKAL